MLKLIVGKKGTGKTKQLISMVNDAVENSQGKIVCIEKGNKLTYDINHGARLIDADEYKISGYDSFFGFVAGVSACDFDVKEIYVDSILKICGESPDEFSRFIKRVQKLSDLASVSFIITVSVDESEIPADAKQYIA